MSFTGFSFFVFFLAVALLYYLLPHPWEKVVLLLGSYVFYMWSLPWLGLVLLATTAVSYVIARLLEPRRTRRSGKLLLALGCVLHLGLLLVLKYAQMAVDLGHALLPSVFDQTTLNLILPVGISFFTFAVTGYLIDVYRGKLPAEKNLLDYSLFVAFFPCILAGPIGQARSFLPQLKQKQPFDRVGFKQGILRFVFGMLQKLVLADGIGIAVNAAYDRIDASPLTWIVIILLYSLQIYFDFAGYSHMAIGIASALGLRVQENFAAPYYSASVTAFWKKWHISLTSWFREYLYFPLGGSRKGRLRTYLNILIVFAVSGLWHGAAVHYVLWGLLNGLFQVWERITQPARTKLENRLRAKPLRVGYLALRGIWTFLLISVTWLFFRADTLTQARQILGQIAGVIHTGFGTLRMNALGLQDSHCIVLGVVLILCAVVDLLQIRGKNTRWLAGSVLPYYTALALLIVVIGVFGIYGAGFDAQDFVYFKY